MNVAVMVRSVLAGFLLLTGCAGTAPETRRSAPEIAAPAPISVTYAGSIAITGLKQAPDGISAGLDGSLYLCYASSGRVLRVERSGTLIASFNVIDPRSEGVFTPIDVSASSSIEVYVLDSSRSRVLRLDRNLRNAYTVYASDPNRRSLFAAFRGIAFDRISGDIFVTDSDNGTVIRIDMLGGVTQTTGTFGTTSVSLKEPAGIDISSDGAILIADRALGAVAIQQNFGAEMNLVGKGILTAPVDVASLPEGFLAVADSRGIVVFDRNGNAVFTDSSTAERTITPRSIACFDNMLFVSDAASASILTYRFALQ